MISPESVRDKHWKSRVLGEAGEELEDANLADLAGGLSQKVSALRIRSEMGGSVRVKDFRKAWSNLRTTFGAFSPTHQSQKSDIPRPSDESHIIQKHSPHPRRD